MNYPVVCRFDGVAFVRYRRGETYHPQRFVAVPESQPDCVVCCEAFIGGEYTTLIPMCPSKRNEDPNRWGNWIAAEVHERCAGAAAKLSGIVLGD